MCWEAGSVAGDMWCGGGLVVRGGRMEAGGIVVVWLEACDVV